MGRISRTRFLRALILNEPHIFSRYGGTRFLLSLGCCVVNTLLLVCGYIDQETYKFLIIGTVGTFIGGNTIQNASESFASRGNSYQYQRGNNDQRQY